MMVVLVPKQKGDPAQTLRYPEAERDYFSKISRFW